MALVTGVELVCKIAKYYLLFTVYNSFFDRYLVSLYVYNLISNIAIMSSDSKLLLGLILGAATGAVAGLLLAPASGKETRENLSVKAGELKSDLDKKINELSKKIKELDDESLNYFKEKFSDIKDSMKEKFDTVSDKVKDLEKELSDKIESIKKESKTMETESNSI